MQFELTEGARTSLTQWLERRSGRLANFVFTSRADSEGHLGTRQLVGEWVTTVGLRSEDYGAEDSDIGRSNLQNLCRSETIGMASVYKVRIDKHSRMEARASMFKSGRVLLRAKAAWLPPYKQELLGLPNVRHDDLEGSTSQAPDITQHRHQAVLWPEVFAVKTRRPIGKTFRRPG